MCLADHLQAGGERKGGPCAPCPCHWPRGAAAGARDARPGDCSTDGQQPEQHEPGQRVRCVLCLPHGSLRLASRQACPAQETARVSCRGICQAASIQGEALLHLT